MLWPRSCWNVARAGRVRIVERAATSNASQPSGREDGSRRRFVAWLPVVLPVLWGFLLAPIAALDVRYASGRATFDQVLFHEHTIDALATTWPSANLTYPDHFVAMTPGYHWVMAGVLRLTGVPDAGLRLVALGLSVAVFSLLGVLLARRCGAVLGAILLAPMLASVYVANSAAWMLADNAGWLWVGVLALAALYGRPNPRWAALVGLGLLLAVWTRQNMLFLALPLWAAAWMRAAPGGVSSMNPLVALPTRARNLLPLAVATLPAIASLVYLHRVWGGLVPYEFQGQYDGANPSNLALQLAMLGPLGVFFLPVILGVGEAGWRSRTTAIVRTAAPWMVLGFLAAGSVAALVPTTHAPTEGRAGMVWQAMDSINVFGPIGRCNPVAVVIAAIGGAVLALVLACVPPRQRWILGALFAGFGVAQGASSEVWQRYHEPFALLFLALAGTVAAAARTTRPERVPWAQAAPVALLALALALTTAALLWQREVSPWRQGKSQTPTSSLLPAPPAQQPAPPSDDLGPPG